MAIDGEQRRLHVGTTSESREKYVEKERKSQKERKAGMASLLIFLISYLKLLLFIEIMTQGDVWISDAALHLGCR